MSLGLTTIDFINLAEKYEFPKKELCDWDKPLQDVLVKAYLDAIPKETVSHILHEARQDVQSEMINEYSPYSQAECVFDAYELYYGDPKKLASMYKEKIYDIVEQTLSGLVEHAFELGDEPDYPGY